MGLGDHLKTAGKGLGRILVPDDGFNFLGREITAHSERGFEVRFPYDARLVDVMKHGLPASGRWVKRAWRFGETPEAVRSIQKLVDEHEFRLDKNAQERLQKATESKTSEWGVILPRDEEPLQCDLARPLYEHQVPAVQFVRRHRRVLIADDVGVGKTAEAVAALEETQAYPALIVCPAVVQEQWVDEFQEMVPGRNVQLLKGRDPQHIGENVDVVVCNDSIISPFGKPGKKNHSHGQVRSLRHIDWASVTVDEVHRIKNNRARRTKAVRELIRDVDVALGLTGTYMPNGDIRELASQLGLIGVLGDLGGWFRFTEHYGVFHSDGYRTTCVDVRNEDELNDRLRHNIMVSRMRDEVGRSIPDAVRQVLRIEISDEWKSKYDNRIQELDDWMDTLDPDEVNRPSTAMAAKSKAQSAVTAAGMGKIPSVVAWAEDRLTHSKPVAIFSWHVEIARSIADTLQAKGKSVALITGQGCRANEKAVKRNEAKKAFTSGECDVLVATIAASGTGMDGLQKRCQDICFAEMPWTPGELEQVEGRLRREGQKGDKVYTTILVAKGTLDEEGVAPVLRRKDRNISKVSGKGTEQSLHNILYTKRMQSVRSA